MSDLPPSPPPAFLPHDQLRDVVRLAPLVAIDLVIRNGRGEILLGLRNNEPAKGSYFAPGGMILKNERLRDAFARILKNETNFTAAIEDAVPWRLRAFLCQQPLRRGRLRHPLRGARL